MYGIISWYNPEKNNTKRLNTLQKKSNKNYIQSKILCAHKQLVSKPQHFKVKRSLQQTSSDIVLEIFK